MTTVPDRIVSGTGSRRTFRSQIIDLALEIPESSPRELAVRYTDEKQYFVSEASVYRLLKAHDLITSPAYERALSRLHLVQRIDMAAVA